MLSFTLPQLLALLACTYLAGCYPGAILMALHRSGMLRWPRIRLPRLSFSLRALRVSSARRTGAAVKFREVLHG